MKKKPPQIRRLRTPLLPVWARRVMLVPLILTVLTQPTPLAEKATEAAVSAQPIPPTEKAAGEAAPPTEKWVTSSCDFSHGGGCVHMLHMHVHVPTYACACP